MHCVIVPYIEKQIITTLVVGKYATNVYTYFSHPYRQPLIFYKIIIIVLAVYTFDTLF